MTSAVVVGSGPNGLAAGLTLAAAGVEVTVLEAASTPGGGTRSTVSGETGLLHDDCSGFHPLAVDTAFSRTFDLQAHGLRYATPSVQFSHPLDGGGGASVWQSVDRTADGLGVDADRYRRLFGGLNDRFDLIAEEFLQPMLHLPRHPMALARFGAVSALPATWLMRLFREETTRALLAGVTAHAFRPLGGPLSSAIGVALGTAAHRYGWPVALGGSASISRAMIAALEARGGTVVTDQRVGSLKDLDSPDVVLLDTSPQSAAQIIGDRLPRRVDRAYRRFRHGPAAFQVALAVDGGIPWSYRPARESGTVHLGGGSAEIAAAESATWRGHASNQPFVLLGQQYLADPERAQGDLVPVDAYAHVPNGYTGDATTAILDQIERFAPGARQRIRHVEVRSTAAITQHNPNYVGGDIVTGANTPRQLVFRPRAALDPYSTGVPGVYLCSAATPPGAGAHGMCGWHAARSALRHLGIGLPAVSSVSV